MMTASSALDLALEDRTGLPDTLAYLRAGYPKEAWRAHHNFGQLTAFWLDTHQTLREHGRQLGQATQAFREGQWDAAGFRAFFVPRLNHFLQHLDGHHRIEDEVYFPKFRALDQRMIAGFDLLEQDHELIHEALMRSADSGRALLHAMTRGADLTKRAADTYAAEADRLLGLLVQHLADEEDLVVPAMLHHGERPVS